MHRAHLMGAGLGDFQPLLDAGGRPLWQGAARLREFIERTAALGHACARCLALPRFSPEQGQADWYVPFASAAADGRYRIQTWAEASRAEQDAALAQLQNLERRLGLYSQWLRCHDDDPQCAEFACLLCCQQHEDCLTVLHFPGPECVFIVDGQPVLAFWGFVRPGEHPGTLPLEALGELMQESAPPPEPAAPPPARRRINPLRWLLLAVAVLVAVVAGLLYWMTLQARQVQEEETAPKLPGPQKSVRYQRPALPGEAYHESLTFHSAGSYEKQRRLLNQSASLGPPLPQEADAAPPATLPDPHAAAAAAMTSSAPADAGPGAAAAAGSEADAGGGYTADAVQPPGDADALRPSEAPAPAAHGLQVPLPDAPAAPAAAAGLMPEPVPAPAPASEPAAAAAPAAVSAAQQTADAVLPAAAAPAAPPLPAGAGRAESGTVQLAAGQQEAVGAAAGTGAPQRGGAAADVPDAGERMPPAPGLSPAADAADGAAAADGTGAAGHHDDAAQQAALSSAAVSAGQSEALNGIWQSRSGLMDTHTGQPLNMSYAFHDGQGIVTVTRAHGVRCSARTAAHFAAGTLRISAPDPARCPDGRTLTLPEITCTPEGTGRARCRGRYAGGEDFPIILYASP